MEKEINYSVEIVKFLWKRVITIVIFTVAVTLSVFVASVFSLKKYTAKAKVMPATTASVSNYLMSEHCYSDPFIPGEESDLEMLLEVFQNQAMADSLINRFSLVEYYGCTNNESPYYETKLKIENNFIFEKSNFGMVEINVIDKDPEKAAEFANASIEIADNILDNALKQRITIADNVLNKQYDTLKKLFEQTDKTSPLYKKRAENLADLERHLIESKINTERFPHLSIISKADIPDRKSSPKTLYNTILAAISSLITVVAALALIKFLMILKAENNELFVGDKK